MEKINEHQAIEQDGDIPLLIPLVVNAGQEFGEHLVVLRLELPKEPLRNALHIESGLQAASDGRDRHLPLLVELADVNDHAREFGEEQVTRLPFDKMMVAGVGPIALALHPIPEALRSRRIQEDKQIFVMEFRGLFVNRGTLFSDRESCPPLSSLREQRHQTVPRYVSL